MFFVVYSLPLTSCYPLASLVADRTSKQGPQAFTRRGAQSARRVRYN
jgi:hypothetical protein